MSLWKRLQTWWRGDESDESAEPEMWREPEAEGLAVDRPAEHSFDRDSRWTGTYPA